MYEILQHGNMEFRMALVGEKKIISIITTSIIITYYYTT